MNFKKSEWRYFNPFRDGRTTNNAEQADLANFDAKIGCHGSNVP